MVDILYNFIRNVVIGASSELSGADELALLLTWTSIVLIFLVMVKLIMWAFGIVFKRKSVRL